MKSPLQKFVMTKKPERSLEDISMGMEEVLTTLKKPKNNKVEVTNLEIPTEVEIKKPIWFSLDFIVAGIGNYIKEAIGELKAFTFKVKVETDKEYGQVTLVNEKGEPLKLNELLTQTLSRRQRDYIQSFPDSMTVTNQNGTPLGTLSGTSTNGTRDLTSANTWYAVPSTVPASPYILVATVENSVGTVRFGFDNTGTPSSTYGNQAPSQLTVRLAANQVIYYASSTAGDDVNWTTKII